MKPSLVRTSFAALALALAFGLAACGSSNDNSTTTAADTQTTTSGGQSGGETASAGSQTATVAVDDNADLGQILVDANGKTLYEFLADKGDTSTCNDACAAAWPPLVTNGDPQAGNGADASLLGTSKRDDGTTQVTYNGHPLYHYAEDEKAGDANGNGSNEFGAEWYALTPKGEEAEGSGKAESGSSSYSSGY